MYFALKANTWFKTRNAIWSICNMLCNNLCICYAITYVTKLWTAIVFVYQHHPSSTSPPIQHFAYSICRQLGMLLETIFSLSIFTNKFTLFEIAGVSLFLLGITEFFEKTKQRCSSSVPFPWRFPLPVSVSCFSGVFRFAHGNIPAIHFLNNSIYPCFHAAILESRQLHWKRSRFSHFHFDTLEIRKAVNSKCKCKKKNYLERS